MSDSSHALERALVRFNARVMGVGLAALSAVGLFAGTLALLARSTETPGAMLGLLGHFFPGYDVSIGGAFIGALWGGAVGFVVGYVGALAYGPVLLRNKRPRVGASPGSEEEVALLAPLALALMTGGLLALALVAGTNWLWFRYGHASPHLELLANYLPGFATTPAGSVLGALWLFAYGFAAAGSVAAIYNRVVIARHPA